MAPSTVWPFNGFAPASLLKEKEPNSCFRPVSRQACGFPAVEHFDAFFDLIDDFDFRLLEELFKCWVPIELLILLE